MEKIDSARKPIWPLVVLAAASIPIFLMVLAILGEIGTIVWEKIYFPQGTGVVDTTKEMIFFFLGRYFAIPCGLINLIVGSDARSKGLLNKKSAVTATVLGVLGLIFGVFAWGLFMVFSSFVF